MLYVPAILETETYAPSCCPDKITFVPDKTFFVKDKIIFVPDKTLYVPDKNFCPKLKKYINACEMDGN